MLRFRTIVLLLLFVMNSIEFNNILVPSQLLHPLKAKVMNNSNNDNFISSNNNDNNEVTANTNQKDEISKQASNSDIVGNVPNVWWRAVRVSDLRKHPLYRPLPYPGNVRATTVRDLTLYRQDSWQWDELHVGRLTTSKAATCLGFYERNTAKIMKIPNSLQSHNRVINAWQQLTQRPPNDYIKRFNKKGRNSDDSKDDISSHINSNEVVAYGRDLNTRSAIWRESKDGNNSCKWRYTYSPYQEKYISWIGSNLQSAGLSTCDGGVRTFSATNARLAWGSAQEATAVLAALDYFSSLDQSIEVLESGMYPFEALKECPAHNHYLQRERDRSQQSNPKDPIANNSNDEDNNNVDNKNSNSNSNSSDIGNTKLSASAKKRLKKKKQQSNNNNSVNSNTNQRTDLVSQTQQVYDTVDQLIKDNYLPLIGASPDGIIHNKTTNTVEVLEVKCSSPYINNNNYNDGNSDGSNNSYDNVLKISNSGFSHMSTSGPPVWHVPQIQLEMFCVGAHCRSAVIETMTATHGARLYRMHRDDEYILLMMRLLSTFYTRFIKSVPSNKRKPPSPNYFDCNKTKDYKEFIQQTQRLANDAQLITEISQNNIQRSPYNVNYFL